MRTLRIRSVFIRIITCPGKKKKEAKILRIPGFSAVSGAKTDMQNFCAYEKQVLSDKISTKKEGPGRLCHAA